MSEKSFEADDYGDEADADYGSEVDVVSDTEDLAEMTEVCVAESRGSQTQNASPPDS